MPCRINKRRVWVGRLVLEQLVNELSCFVTLTYDEEHLPPDGTLVKADLQKFMKLLRYYLPGRAIRYFGCGEYGEQTWRPHYHLILFGVSPVESEVISKAWPHGLIHVGMAQEQSMSYVAGYVCKKMTSSVDLRLGGRAPEFSLMSRKPAIGTPALKNLALAVQNHPAHASHLLGFLPRVFRSGSKTLPIGRTLTNKLAVMLNISPAQKAELMLQKSMDLRVVFQKEGIKEYVRRRHAGVLAQRGKIMLERKKSL